MSEYSSDVRFHPWVGGGFSSPTLACLKEHGIRLLVLGESHYGKEAEGWGHNSTNWIIKNWAINSRNAFFTKIALTLLPENASSEDRETIASVYRDIAFYNYVQTLVPESRRSPTSEQFRDGFLAFQEVVQHLRPTHVWMLGKRLWNHMPSEAFVYLGEIAPEGQRDLVGKYTFGRTEVVCFGTNHPSGGYSTGRWRKFVHAVLKETATSI